MLWQREQQLNIARAKARGYTLLEILIAMSISVILLAAVLQVFENNKRTHELSTAISEVQENGRFAIDTMVADLRMVGYQGCADPDGVQEKTMLMATGKEEDGGSFDPPMTNALSAFNAEALRGYEVSGDDNWLPAVNFSTPDTDVAYVGNGQLGEATGSGALENTHVLAMKHAWEGTEIVAWGLGATSNASATAAGTVDATDPLATMFPYAVDDAANDTTQMAIVGDCDDAVLVTMASLNPATGDFSVINDLEAFPDSFAPGDLVLPFGSSVYYIKDSGVVDSQGNPIYSLYSRDLINDTGVDEETELVSNVENMRILYGERDANGDIRFVPASGVTDFAEVSVIQLGLLLRSSEAVLSGIDQKTYRLPGTTLVRDTDGDVERDTEYASDGHLRQAFVTTVKLRNRAITFE